MATGTSPQAGQRIDPAEYRRLVDEGAFDEDARMELIEGFILPMSPKSREHEHAIEWLNVLLVRSLDLDQYRVRVGSPLTIGGSEPEPDLTVVERGTPEPNHPASAALVIEVAHWSHERDLVTKPRVYASAGVSVYWVVDVDRREVTVHAGPHGDHYQRVNVVERGTVDASHVGIRPIVVADLFAAAHR
jgi:Uma2 family endonuclease